MIGKISPNISFVRLLALVTVVFGGGCSRMEDKQITIGDVTYSLPSDHVEAFTKPGEGQPYVRLRPPKSPYDLIYSARATYRTNWTGKDTPLVTSVNDHMSPSFEHFKFPGGLTVCRSDQPYYSCGLQIDHRGVTWSIVFSRDEVPNSDAIRTAAARILETYRS
jgi:hypothetical protein